MPVLASEALAGPRPRGRGVSTPMLALLLLPVALVSFWGLREIEKLEQRQLASALQTVLSTTQTGLHIWSRQIREDTATWASSDPLLDLVEQLMSGSKRDLKLRASPVAMQIRELLQPAQRRQGYQGYVIIGPDGTELAASIEGEIGTKLLQQNDPATIAQAFGGRVTLGIPFHSKIPLPSEDGDWYSSYPTMIVAAPISNSDGLVVAVLAFRLDPGANFTRVTRLGRLGKTGETYAFDQLGRMLTETRFDQQLRDIGLIGPGQTNILTIDLKDPGVDLTKGYRPEVPRSKLPLTAMAKSAQGGLGGMDLEGYRDYRGVPVIGAWVWDSELRLGLASEIDKAEAYEPLWLARTIILFMLAVVILVAGFASAILARRATALAATVAREQAALSAKDEVLQVISHDLKNPLGVISLSSGLILKEEETNGLHVTIRKHVRTIERAAERMAQLIDDLLQTSLIEAGRLKLDCQLLDPIRLLDRVYDLQEPLAAQKAIHLKKEILATLPTVWGDEPRLLRVFTNLIGNAVKFTPEGGAILLQARKNDQNEIWFSIRDSGPGIPEKDLPHIFERYYQAARTAAMGTGLGLFIAKGIVEAHGGRMWVESDAGKGATFHFALPEATARKGRE